MIKIVDDNTHDMSGKSTTESFKTGEFHGDAHNALFDVINQIDTLFKAKDHYAPVSAQ